MMGSTEEARGIDVGNMKGPGTALKDIGQRTEA